MSDAALQELRASSYKLYDRYEALLSQRPKRSYEEMWKAMLEAIKMLEISEDNSADYPEIDWTCFEECAPIGILLDSIDNIALGWRGMYIGISGDVSVRWAGAAGTTMRLHCREYAAMFPLYHGPTTATIALEEICLNHALALQSIGQHAKVLNSIPSPVGPNIFPAMFLYAAVKLRA